MKRLEFFISSLVGTLEETGYVSAKIQATYPVRRLYFRINDDKYACPRLPIAKIVKFLWYILSAFISSTLILENFIGLITSA